MDIEDLANGNATTESASLPGQLVLKKWKAPQGVLSSASDVPGTQSVWVKTFGCAHNVSDSEYMAGQLSGYGYRLFSPFWIAPRHCRTQHKAKFCPLQVPLTKQLFCEVIRRVLLQHTHKGACLEI